MMTTYVLGAVAAQDMRRLLLVFVGRWRERRGHSCQGSRCLSHTRNAGSFQGVLKTPGLCYVLPKTCKFWVTAKQEGPSFVEVWPHHTGSSCRADSCWPVVQ